MEEAICQVSIVGHTAELRLVERRPALDEVAGEGVFLGRLAVAISVKVLDGIDPGMSGGVEVLAEGSVGHALLLNRFGQGENQLGELCSSTAARMAFSSAWAMALTRFSWI